ncbi:hypothetical protein [Flavobacterium collinsii]|jgi:hypothetical protein|uniref:Imelysin-like domain-containing protein n=1 Tax=Flavobacterium collinsii TaxID=1114861 RepID=A0ABM8KE50_9FLAO|nr:hypothetical protein [Flavobacterium collinsii]CAA9195306.1 hypothetical protein FLACOL7796_00563 [Flavobacterium collinsii]
MNFKKIALYVLPILAVGFTSCTKDEQSTPPLVIPTAYDATSYTVNVVGEYELRTNFAAFINEVKKGRVAGTTVTESKLKELFEAGTNSVSKNTTVALRTEFLMLFAEIEKASKGKTYQFGKTPTENINGGVAGGYLFDETGLELEQIIDKGSFGGVFYNKAIEVLANPTLVNLDKALALYGANPTFPNTPTVKPENPQPDILMANYGARRTKGTGGLYTEVRAAFIKAQAAIKAGEKYNADRDAAIAEILIKWEQINAGTVINYLFDVEARLTTAPATDASKAAAMHSYGECVGFLKGFKGFTKKKITDAQLDDALTKMNNTASYKLIDNQVEIAKLLQIRNSLQAIYGFTDTQMVEFKNNYVKLENR